MNTESQLVFVDKPNKFDAHEIDDFVAFVLVGGEVTQYGLRNRIMNASHLAIARQKSCLVGVGGLKIPGSGYREEIEKKSGENLSQKYFPYELGWVFVLPSARGRGLSGKLCQALVQRSDGRGVFATSRADNVPMHRTLIKLGFKRVGKEWQSKENESSLALFVKETA